MKYKFSYSELAALVVVTTMSFLANLPERLAGNLVDKKLILTTLVAVIVVAMFRYLQILLLIIISVLAIGANLPEDLAAALGISKIALIASLGLLIAVALFNRIVKLLAARNAKPDEILDVATAHNALLTAIAKGDIDTVNMLLEMKVGANFTLNGTTPLHLAAEKGYSAIVQTLLDHGADPQQRNADGMMPLQVALSMKKFMKTTEILFEASKSSFTNPAQSQKKPGDIDS